MPYYVADVKAKIAEMTDGKMAARVIVPTVPRRPWRWPSPSPGRRSTIVFFGLPGDKDVFSRARAPEHSLGQDDSLLVAGPGVWQTALGALATGLVDVAPLVSKAYPLQDLAKALGDVKDRVGNPMKPVVVP